MKKLLLMTTVAVLLYSGSLFAGELGVMAGGYSRESDIGRINNLTGVSTWTDGDRTWAPYFGIKLAHNFFGLPVLELEHTLGFALEADKTANPNTFIYSTSLNFILPLDFVKVRPFVGAGIGFAKDFGNPKNVNEAVAQYIGNQSKFLVNIGGGAKVMLSDKWWLKLTLRDYILPNYEKVSASVISGNLTNQQTVNESVHNLTFNVGLVYKY